jgi:hypothetical protein
MENSTDYFSVDFSIVAKQIIASYSLLSLQLLKQLHDGIALTMLENVEQS